VTVTIELPCLRVSAPTPAGGGHAGERAAVNKQTLFTPPASVGVHKKI